MKKLVASVGLVALGASTLQAASLPNFLTESGKPWSISATLRGFYDDNINSLPDNFPMDGYERDSFGFQVSPTLSLSLNPSQTTSLRAGYTYSFLWYANKLYSSSDHNDQTHQFDFELNHAFSERYTMDVRDSFVIGQEPDMLRTGDALTSFQRIPGDNIRNFGAINADAELTHLLGVEVGYANSYFDYAANAPVYGYLFGFAPYVAQPSIGGLLNRIDNTVHLDTRWHLQPTTVAVAGYRFDDVDYTSDSVIFGGDPFGFLPTVTSDERNSRSHTGYVGLDETFRPDLTGSLRVGGEYTEYYNDPSGMTSVSPYVQASLRWTYQPESFVEMGVSHDRNATDLLGDPTKGNITVDQESTVVYASITQKLFSKVYANLLGRFQDSTFNGGVINNTSERYYEFGANLQYRFNPNISTSVGYTYDNLDSPEVVYSGTGYNRSFDRNRVYIGLTATY